MPDPGAALAGSAPTAQRGWARLLRRLAVAAALTCFTALVFVGALAVTLPAPVLGTLVTLPPQVEGLSGSAWRGRASLAGGHALSWEASFAQLWRGRLLADASLEGPDTRLTGTLTVSPWQVQALDWTGRAGPGLLALAPRLAVASCTSRAVVEVARLALGRRSAAANGSVEVAAGACATRGGSEVPVPAMTLALSTEGRDARAALTRDDDGALLATLGVTGDRRLLVRVEPEGAALVPGMPSSAPTILELPF